MTRENKLALVVGFGLILFVGILISDHFSVVRSQHAADLTKPIDDPLLVAVNSQSGLIDLVAQPKHQAPEEPQFEPVSNGAPNTFVQGSGPVPSASGSEVTPLGDNLIAPDGAVAQDSGSQTIPGFVPHDEPPATRVEEFVFHDVKSGETLYGICRQHFGNTTKVKDVAEYNNLDDDASLRVGQRLRIPTGSSSSSAGGSPMVAAKTSISAIKVTYTVKDGDSLSEIAQRFLGSKGKWKKLYQMNRDVIDDPDNVRVGTVLRVS